MRFEGYLVKSGKFWAVEIPLLHIHTQGRSRKDAYAMAKDAIESLLEEKEFKVRIHPGQADTFAIEANGGKRKELCEHRISSYTCSFYICSALALRSTKALPHYISHSQF